MHQFILNKSGEQHEYDTSHDVRMRSRPALYEAPAVINRMKLKIQARRVDTLRLQRPATAADAAYRTSDSHISHVRDKMFYFGKLYSDTVKHLTSMLSHTLL